MITLAREGIFPITQLPDGTTVQNATGLNIPGTIQGEGKLAGTPSIFIRTHGCNLRCIWSDNNGAPQPCDTDHASFSHANTLKMSAEEIYQIVKLNAGKIRHIVITGGEPLLQAQQLHPLATLLRNNHFHTTIETNGTLFDQQLLSLMNLISISPKLPSSVPSKHKTSKLGLSIDNTALRHDALIADVSNLQKIINLATQKSIALQLKFVISCPDDEIAIDNILSQLTNISQDDILLMPLGTNNTDMQSSNNLALRIALQRGWRFAPRLHIMLFGNREGV